MESTQKAFSKYINTGSYPQRFYYSKFGVGRVLEICFFKTSSVGKIWWKWSIDHILRNNDISVTLGVPWNFLHVSKCLNNLSTTVCEILPLAQWGIFFLCGNTLPLGNTSEFPRGFFKLPLFETVSHYPLLRIKVPKGDTVMSACCILGCIREEKWYLQY